MRHMLPTASSGRGDCRTEDLPHPNAASRPQVPMRGTEYLPARMVWERYGVTDMTIWRWLRDERMDFPKPFYLGRFRYWRIADLEAWETRQARRVA